MPIGFHNTKTPLNGLFHFDDPIHPGTDQQLSIQIYLERSKLCAKILHESTEKLFFDYDSAPRSSNSRPTHPH